MTTHSFHSAIGELINDGIIKQKNFPKIESLKLWQENAYETTGGFEFANES